MLKNRYHDQLRSVPLFADLAASELDLVAAATTELSVPAGRVLMREGEVAHEMFVVLEGTLEVSRAGCHVASIGAGSFVGEMALLTHHQRDATVTAVTPARILHVDGRSFSTVLRDAPAVAVTMLPVVADRAVGCRCREAN